MLENAKDKGRGAVEGVQNKIQMTWIGIDRTYFARHSGRWSRQVPKSMEEAKVAERSKLFDGDWVIL